MNSAEFSVPDANHSPESDHSGTAQQSLGELASKAVVMTEADLLKRAGDKAAAAFPDDPKWAEAAREMAIWKEQQLISQARMDYADAQRALQAYEVLRRTDSQDTDSSR